MPSGIARRVLALLVALIALAAAATAAQADPPAPASGQVWQQTFGDDFSGTSLDATKWTTCYWWQTPLGCTNANNGELEWYQPQNVSVSDGAAHLQAKQETVLGTDGKTYNYTSGMISTGNDTGLLTTPPRYQFTYGYMEMRAKIPTGKGLWPAFWTLATSHNWPPEIDAMEILGDKTTQSTFGVHYKDANGAAQDISGYYNAPSDLSTAYHTWGMDWEPTGVYFYIDGVRVGGASYTQIIPTEPMYVIANLAVGGNWPGSPDSTTTFPASFDIDYVKVWQQKPAPTDTTPPTVAVTSPASGSTVKRSTSVTVAAGASDDTAVQSVTLYANGAALCTDTSAPYTCTWKTPKSKSQVNLTAQATDTAGNAATSAAVRVNVS